MFPRWQNHPVKSQCITLIVQGGDKGSEPKLLARSPSAKKQQDSNSGSEPWVLTSAVKEVNSLQWQTQVVHIGGAGGWRSGPKGQPARDVSCINLDCMFIGGGFGSGDGDYGGGRFTHRHRAPSRCHH